MLDPLMRRLMDPPLNALAARLGHWPGGADGLTLMAFAFGLASAAALAMDAPLLALAFFAANRLGDGLDGALARRSRPTDRGGFLDIVLDFAVYALLVFAFAWRDPAAALAAGFLLASFMGTASSFLAYAVIAAKRGASTAARGPKSFYHLGGLAEGTETILFFAICLMRPDWFASAAWIFGSLCWLTTLGRVAAGWRDFRDEPLA